MLNIMGKLCGCFVLVSGAPVYFLSSVWGVSIPGGIACHFHLCVF